MPFDTLSLMTVVLMSLVASLPDAQGGRLGPIASCVALRQVLRADPYFERVIDQLWDRSPTFRRQLTRLAEGGLLVTLEQCGTACPGALRAQTTVEHRRGVVAQAIVRLQFRPAEAPELIGHELEHVIEQLDGVDLAQLASRGNHVIQADEERYETVRAHQIGRIVAAEHKAGRRRGCRM